MPQVSLCVVARNEVGVIRPCLESARETVDEIVVVDTGSTDGTPELAERCGAVVHRLPYPGNQAEAFDLPLRFARGDWVLVLDADEILDPRARIRLPELIRTDLDGYLVEQRNYSYDLTHLWRRCDPMDPVTRGARGYLSAWNARLFRRRPWIRYDGKLHQTVFWCILRHGGRVERCDLPIHHHGYLRTHRSEWKKPTYLRLTAQQLDANPRNARSWIEHGLCLLGCKRPHPAFRAFRRAGALGYSPGACAYLEGWASIEKGSAAAAVPLLRRSLRLHHPKDIDYEPAGAWELLGEALIDAGRSREAERALSETLALRPDSPAAANNLAALASERGRLDEARSLLEDLIARHPWLDMTWTTLGANRLRAGDRRGARRAFETALEIRPRNPSARANVALLRPEPVRKSIPRRRGGVVALIPELIGGAGRILYEGMRALAPAPRTVICGDAGDHSGFDWRERLGRIGVAVCVAPTPEDVRRALTRIRPGVVFHHWWPSPAIEGPLRRGSERWIAVGHACLPMPEGYDEYLVPSRAVGALQAHLASHRVRLFAPPPFRRGAARARGGRELTIGMIARLEASRFPRRLLSFLPDLSKSKARLHIVGRGERRHEIEPTLNGAGLSGRVRFLGAVSSARIASFLRTLDVGLFLTEMHEPTAGLAVCEMMSAGIPVVAQPRGCIPERIRHGRTGLLADSEGDVRRCLSRLLSDAALRERIGSAARRASVNREGAPHREAWRSAASLLRA